MAQPKVALQLYTVREELRKDFLGTLRAVARIGYPAVQFAGYGGLAAVKLRDALARLGLAAAGSHVGFEALESHPDQEIAYCLELGTRDVVIPAIPSGWRGGKDDYHRFAEALNRIGARCRELGARLSYHNHSFEFVTFDGRYALDLLLEWCDPQLVAWEPDVYWIKHGGEDPAAFIRTYNGRTPLVHLKDMTADDPPTYAEVGEGILDWPAIFAASEASGAEWYVVEQDTCARPPLEAVALSLRHLQEWNKL